MRFEAEDVTTVTGKVRYYAKGWSGPKAKKPFAYFAFLNEASRDKWITDQKAAKDRTEEYRAQRKADESAKLEEMRAQLKVGDILAYSWGWEQTNVDFFEVVARKGAGTVVLREIASELVKDSGCGAMSGYVTPKPGAFLQNEKPIEKRITAYGVTMDHGIATPTEPGKKHYCSWYA